MNQAVWSGITFSILSPGVVGLIHFKVVVTEVCRSNSYCYIKSIWWQGPAGVSKMVGKSWLEVKLTFLYLSKQ